MTPITKPAQKILQFLVDSLDGEGCLKLDKRPGAFMPVSLERITGSTYALAHYREECGDLVADPDMVFWRSASGEFFPVSIKQPGMHQRVALVLDAEGRPASFYPKTQKELAAFAGLWLRNIKGQQGLTLQSDLRPDAVVISLFRDRAPRPIGPSCA